MLRMQSLICLVLLVIVSPVYAHDSVMRLVVPEFRPFTYMNQSGLAAGTGVDSVKRILQSLEIPFSLRVVPNYGRALAELKEGRADAFFLATENAERNAHATLSSPIVINHWSWFTLTKGLSPGAQVFREEASVGTILNTNTHKWLESEAYRVSIAATEPVRLIELLILGRIDAIFLAENVFYGAYTKIAAAPDVTQTIEKSLPMGVYISKSYQTQHPDFMTRFNAKIQETTPLTYIP